MSTACLAKSVQRSFSREVINIGFMSEMQAKRVLQCRRADRNTSYARRTA
jgi:hypothetical protein